MAADRTFAIHRRTKDRVPALPFVSLKTLVLGEKYDLSLVIVGDRHSRTLNEKYRGKTYIPNVLSFPVSDGTGEIFLNLKQAKREHAARGESLDFFIALLFIHSMLHLKGYAHGATMEREEARFLAKAGIRNTGDGT